MPNLPIPSGNTGFLPDVDRRAQRDIVRAQSAGAIVTARERAKVDAIADVTQTALIATAHISAMEALLVSRCPHAEARLKHIADAGCAGMSNVVLSMSRYC